MTFWKQAEDDPDVDALTAAVVLVGVHSRGSVRLRSADPAWAPAIDADYLTDGRGLHGAGPHRAGRGRAPRGADVGVRTAACGRRRAVRPHPM